MQFDSRIFKQSNHITRIRNYLAYCGAAAAADASAAAAAAVAAAANSRARASVSSCDSAILAAFMLLMTHSRYCQITWFVPSVVLQPAYASRELSAMSKPLAYIIRAAGSIKSFSISNTLDYTIFTSKSSGRFAFWMRDCMMKLPMSANLAASSSGFTGAATPNADGVTTNWACKFVRSIYLDHTLTHKCLYDHIRLPRR